MNIKTKFLFAAILTIPSHAVGATSTNLGAAGAQLYQRGDNDAIETKTTPRVRIPVVLRAWSEVDTTGVDGRSAKSKIAARPVSHVLRARMEQPNDFYVGDWRVQTTPQRWLKNSGQFQVKLEIFRRYGEAGQLEESMGSTLLTGVLETQADGLYVLNGTARRSFRDRDGKPLLDFEAGQHAPNEPNPVAVSKLVPRR